MVNSSKLFAKNLQKLLNETGWSQADLSRRTKIPQPAISRWVKGDVSPGLDSIDRIASAFGVNSADFISSAVISAPSRPDVLSMLDMLREDFLALEERARGSRDQRLSEIPGDILEMLPDVEHWDLIRTVLKEAVKSAVKKSLAD